MAVGIEKPMPGGLSADMYVERELRPSDADHYSAAGILPYRKSGEGIEVLLAKEQPWNSFEKAYDPLAWNVLSGKRVPRMEWAAEATVLRSFHDSVGDVQDEAPFDDLRSKLLTYTDAGSFVSWYPKGKFALLFVEVGSSFDDLPAAFAAQGGPKAEKKDGRWLKQIEALEWVASTDLHPEPKHEVADLLQNFLQAADVKEFLGGELDPITAWPLAAPPPEGGKPGNGMGKWSSGGGKGNSYGGRGGGKGWAGKGGRYAEMFFEEPLDGPGSEMQRQALGEQLFILVQALTPTTLAAQTVTGMLVELPMNELVMNLTSPDELVWRVAEAMKIIGEGDQ